MRKARAFRGGANKTAPPCFPKAVNSNFATVPVEQLQRNITLQQIVLLGKPIFSVRQKGVPPLLLPASVLQLPRCLARTYNLDSYHSTLFELKRFKKCNCSRENRLQNTICFANVGYSPTLWQHLLTSLRFLLLLIIHSLQGTAVPCTPRRAEPARPQLPAARILQPLFYKKAAM